jgi:hypothetical protein
VAEEGVRAGYLFLASFLLLPVAGAPLLSHPTYRRFPGACRIVLSGAAGAVLVSATMTGLALAGLRWSLPGILLPALALGWLLRRLLAGAETPGDGPPSPPAPAAVRAAWVFSFLAVAAAFLGTAAGAATSNDLVFFWGPKAAQFAQARTLDARFLGDPLLNYMHPYYPPLVTNLWAFGAMAAGRFPWGAVTATFPLFLAALALGLPGVLRTALPRSRAHAVSCLAVSALASIGLTGFVAGNAEMPLFLFETLGIALLLSPFSSESAGRLLAGLLLAGAASAKVEGLPVVLSAVFLFAILERRRARPAGKALAFLLAPTVVVLGLWFAYGASRRLFFGYQGTGRLLDIHWNRAGQILAGIPRALLDANYALPYLVPFLVFLLMPRGGRRWMVPVGVLPVLALFFVFIYLHVPDPTLFIQWSAARVFAPAAILFALAAAMRGATGEAP